MPCSASRQVEASYHGRRAFPRRCLSRPHRARRPSSKTPRLSIDRAIRQHIAHRRLHGIITEGGPRPRPNTRAEAPPARVLCPRADAQRWRRSKPWCRNAFGPAPHCYALPPGSAVGRHRFSTLKTATGRWPVCYEANRLISAASSPRGRTCRHRLCRLDDMGKCQATSCRRSILVDRQGGRKTAGVVIHNPPEFTALSASERATAAVIDGASRWRCTSLDLWPTRPSLAAAKGAISRRP